MVYLLYQVHYKTGYIISLILKHSLLKPMIHINNSIYWYVCNNRRKYSIISKIFLILLIFHWFEYMSEVILYLLSSITKGETI